MKKKSKSTSEKLTEVNTIKIPAVPGSCYHAIMCALASQHDHLLYWDRIVELTERYMIQYGGHEAWDDFKSKSKSKTCLQRIKENTHTLTRTGKGSYGYRLHENGLSIYYFSDGAILLTDGNFEKQGRKYTVEFPDGRGLQVRYRGTIMSSKEYKRFLEQGLIDRSGTILDLDKIHELRKKQSAPMPDVFDLDLS